MYDYRLFYLKNGGRGKGSIEFSADALSYYGMRDIWINCQVTEKQYLYNLNKKRSLCLCVELLALQVN